MLAMNIFDLKSYDRFQGYGLGLSTVLKRMVTFSFLKITDLCLCWTRFLKANTATKLRNHIHISF